MSTAGHPEILAQASIVAMISGMKAETAVSNCVGPALVSTKFGKIQ